MYPHPELECGCDERSWRRFGRRWFIAQRTVWADLIVLESAILPLFVRRTQEVGQLLPELYLHGLSQGDFELALRGLLGEGAPLSASSIARLRDKWIVEYNAWRHRRLDDRELVYAWADGIVRHEAPENRVGCKDPPTGCRSSPLKLEAA